MDAALTFLTHLVTFFHTILPFSGSTWFILLMLGFFTWIFAKGHRDPNSCVRWEHLIVDSHNDRASPYKVGYLSGVMVATWIVITLADAGTLSVDMFGAYLVTVLGGAGVNSYTKLKEQVSKVTKEEK